MIKQKSGLNLGLLQKEKEKLKAIYLLSEKELKKYAKETIISSENPTNSLLRKLETRLDNVVYRLGYALDRVTAKELIMNGHVFINDARVTDPTYRIGPRDILEFKKDNLHWKLPIEKRAQLPGWLLTENNTARMRHLPTFNELRRKDIDLEKVIKYYSVI